METKTLLAGIIGFMLGGLVVATAATTINKPEAAKTTDGGTAMSMDDMAASLESKTGDAYDKAFIAGMIDHHQGAIDMARQSAAQAKHDEIKRLSNDIITAQEEEIRQMERWQRDWGYEAGADSHTTGH